MRLLVKNTIVKVSSSISFCFLPEKLKAIVSGLLNTHNSLLITHYYLLIGFGDFHHGSPPARFSLQEINSCFLFGYV